MPVSLPGEPEQSPDIRQKECEGCGGPGHEQSSVGMYRGSPPHFPEVMLHRQGSPFPHSTFSAPAVSFSDKFLI